MHAGTSTRYNVSWRKRESSHEEDCGQPMIAQELEVSLHMAFVEARQKRHEFITVEHLLLALLDNPTAAEVLRACAANIEELRKALGDFITAHTPTVAGTAEIDTQPTLGFQRVIQRAILHVQSSGKKEVTGANVLVAIFGEKDSHAVYFLHQQGVTRLDVVNYISHGITKTPASKEAKAGGARTIPCSWERRAWARRQSPKASRDASSRARCPRSSRAARSTCSTWVRCSREPSTA